MSHTLVPDTAMVLTLLTVNTYCAVQYQQIIVQLRLLLNIDTSYRSTFLLLRTKISAQV